MNVALLDNFCSACGVITSYRDVWGGERSVPIESRLALLAAMGWTVASDADIQHALEEREAQAWRRMLPPVQVVRTGGPGLTFTFSIPDAYASQRFEWALVEEGGARRGAAFVPEELEVAERRRIAGAGFARYAVTLPDPPGPGYHRIELAAPERTSLPRTEMALIVAPQRCYVPDALARGRVWGPMVNLYALRSRRNWGIGDFNDLRALTELAARHGASMVGVNPLHALFPHDPEHASPYSPASRLLLNVLYLDVESVPEFSECAPARERAASPAFRAELHALRAADLIDYRRVAKAKFEVLELLYAHFRAHHVERDSDRARAFRAFQREGGETLRFASIFFTLQETLYAADGAAWGWRTWPSEYRDPSSSAVAEFAAAHVHRTEYYDYLQWNAAQQLESVGARSLELHLGIGIYQDLAVGADPGGAESWAAQWLYAPNVTVGCPPDDFNLKGQDWGIMPPVPARLTEVAYAPFVSLLRANMRHAGALRIDHVMELMRLFWIPAGGDPDRGGYVSYPIDDLLGVLALESERNRCLVIGEDLGTLPEGLAERLRAESILSYRLLYFQREADSGFSPPQRYPAHALAAISTHDLPALRAFWLGRDLDLRTRLDLYPNEELRRRQLVERAQDRGQLLVALERENLLPPGVTVHPVSVPDVTPEFALAVHRFLARTPCQVLAVQPENVFGELEQLNLPATTGAQYPNWRHRAALELERWAEDARFLAVAEALRAERGAAPAPAEARRAPFVTRIPDATYRLQFNRAFTFARATELVPYLHELGVSHCYASPYFSARPGSLHGYDIVDHNAFNPEIGSAEEFDRLVEALRAHGMGQVLDMVPNHMGVMGADNAWWLDVLESGPSSTYASFFDIDWLPVDAELANKVLVPVLGDDYGSVLECGELRLEFDPAAGSFSVRYHEHRFPIDPREYPRILERALGTMETRGLTEAARTELSSLCAAFGHLPVRHDTAPERVAERRRDKELLKRRLARLAARVAEVNEAITNALERLNGSAGERGSFVSLHELLEAQPYRLAYWRVASDEINYRRFFDINALAALRMESEAVFEATHRLVLELAAAGKIDGLRIDHPDGLYDPGQYFRRLQERYAQLSGAEIAPTEERRPARPLYVVAEKITAHHEYVPETWAVHGTTGYRFAALVNGLFVDASAKRRFDRIYRAFVPEAVDFDEAAYDAKATIMRSALASELAVLATELLRIAHADWRTRDYTFNTLRRALAEVVACFPVYRTYIAEQVSAQDRRYVDWAVGQARRRSRDADATVFEFVRSALLAQAADDALPELRERCRAFAMKFQQFTAPVAAKGVEDTAFYRYNRLVSLNEVGSDPRAFGMSLAAFHQASLDRARNWPHTMLATSTHDCKRSEDVRMRIDALSEFPLEWADKLRRWRRITRGKKRSVEEQPAPSANDEYLLYQTLVGTWPLGNVDEKTLAAYRERIERYMLKAVREAKTHSSWMNVNEEYESALRNFISELLDAPERNAFLADFAPFAGRIARVGMFNSLSQVAIKVASPGVPDFYQGAELWQFHLVDPDNRAPVDYAVRSRMLEELKAQLNCPAGERAARARALLERMEDGRAKLYVTWKALTARRTHRALFASGAYQPLEAGGAHATRLCAFARVFEGAAAVLVAPRLIGALIDATDVPIGREIWADTGIVLPGELAGSYRNLFTEEIVKCNGTRELAAAEVLANFPVAILLRQ